ncbi:MAG: grasp-with-spasm system ATP-grasp peptide maturase [Tannerellaceae bacterium]|nr:grasp-with-spasm system ATP-grasp peptide maturase [Tannerellaceae bacterium]
MILIISRLDDPSTSLVIDWLNYYNKKYIRLNGDSTRAYFKKIDDQNIILKDNSLNKEVNLLECNKVWYRRGGISKDNLNFLNEEKAILKLGEENKYIEEILQSEFKVLKEYIYSLLESKITHHMGSYFNRSLNKLTTLYFAKQIGLCIPKTEIVYSKKELDKILKDSRLIIKSLDDGIYHKTKDKFYISYTESLTREFLNVHTDTFLPSLIQYEIQKDYELRIFYFFGNFFASAIFTQSNEETRIDSRRSSGKDVRTIPYSLPHHIKLKLTSLMNKIELDMGSIDMIVSEQNEYIFLEVNPLGQFSAYGDECNYYLERELALKM